MPGDRLAAEAGGEALEEGLGQRDFGEQDQRLPALPQRLGDRLEIDLGLARAGDAVEQEGRELAGVDRGAQLGGRRSLGGLERGRIMIRIGHRKGIVDRDLDRLDRARLDQAADHAVGNAADDRQLAHQAHAGRRSAPAPARAAASAARARWPVARYSMIVRAPSSAPDEGRAMRSTAASGAR